MKINGQEVKGNSFAYDDCHRIYILEDEVDIQEALEHGYKILDLENLETAYNNSCGLKFISNWKLDKEYVDQFEQAVFEQNVIEK